MSFMEIKECIAQLTPDERLELAALITHLNRSEDREYQTELDRRLAPMNRGEKFTQHDLERMHRDAAAKDR